MATYRKLQVFTKTADFGAATKLVEVPLVEPEVEQIRVKNIYAGLNATDINITAGRYFTDGQVPFDIGLEALGIVDAIGSKVTSVKVGQPVLVYPGKPSGFSEYLYAEPKEVIPVPELKANYLVTLVNGLTASIGLDVAGHVKKGDKVLITAAAGGTGQIAVQWAKQKGAYVIATTSTEAKAEYLRQLGADLIINYKQDDLDAVLAEKFPQGVDVVWETIGGQTFATLFKHLARRGRLVMVGTITEYKEKGLHGGAIPDLTATLVLASKSIHGFLVLDHSELFPQYLPELIGGIAAGRIEARVDLGEHSQGGRFFGLDQVCRAEEHLHNSKNVGKVVVQIQEP